MEQSNFFIKYLPMKILLTSVKKAVLPEYLGSTLRGTIGQALHINPVAFNYIYNNRILSDNKQDIINPYMIIPPAIHKTPYQAGEDLSFYMILLGNAIQYASSVIDALGSLEKFKLGASRYPFILKKIVHSLDQRVIWQSGLFYGTAIRSAVVPYRCLSDIEQLTINIKTPLRIRRNGMLLESIDFPTIIRNIIHRIEAITQRYGGWVNTTEAVRIQTLASEIPVTQSRLALKQMSRYSNRLGEKMDFSGLLGSIRCKGVLTPFVPWLYAAQVLHIGRNTTFGMGQIEVEFI
ncbi:CRISPR system precrRNA processing endoribonuclease RAMP protein Cas6 [Pectinatus frisingensis]|uniref:CRISPR system precrRNA processing endoribonuclease RAMP protein Cas6 n=1 Tax=Pectinatus frisingensis TaxID=865 RepID=UPI0018C716D3|nr:CRISPR system precrRNA processing endoribonuclease RAMP protein Cas6 [Pectinatus frisingensis]